MSEKEITVSAAQALYDELWADCERAPHEEAMILARHIAAAEERGRRRGVEERDELRALIRECAELRCAHVGASDCVRAISLAANAERCRWRHRFDGQCTKTRRHDGPHEPSDEKRGIYGKYEVRRLNDPTGKHGACDYYVLDWKHDPFVVPAALAYADACESRFPELAVDLRALAAIAARDPRKDES